MELSFVTLSVLIWKGYNKALYACIPLAFLVIIGNSLAMSSLAAAAANDDIF